MPARPEGGLAVARRHRDALVGALLHWEGSSEDDPEPKDDLRRSLRAAGLSSGEGAGAILDLYDAARPQPWTLDLQREGRRLLACGGSSVVLRAPDGSWKAAPCGCGSRLCPVCARPRAARAVARWRPVFEAAAADGAQIRHWTLTQPADEQWGGLVTPLEARRYRWDGDVAEDGLVAPAVGGESLKDAYCRLMDTLTACRDDRSTRAEWKHALGGYLRGIEWTGRSPRAVPRWHVHVHILSITPEPLSDRFVRARLREWAKKADGHVRAQHCRVVDPSRVVEVLKYPFKPASLTQAQRIESLAYARGQRPHQPGGALHGASRAARGDPWRRWLAARPEPRVYRRLHWIDPETGRPEVWRGQPSQGSLTWAVKTEGGGWETWTGDAAPYVALVREVDPTAVEPEPEPGSDLSEELFED